jgi:hypothetical protein
MFTCVGKLLHCCVSSNPGLDALPGCSTSWATPWARLETGVSAGESVCEGEADEEEGEDANSRLDLLL